MRQLSTQLKRPKHLFPVGDTTIVGRIAHELHQSCQQIICIVPGQQQEHFIKEFASYPFPVQVVSKEHPHFYGDFSAAYKYAQYDQIILTVGDLIFPEGAITAFIQKNKTHFNKIVLGLDSTALWGKNKFLDFRIILTAMPKTLLQEIIHINPESFRAVFTKFCSFWVRNKVRPRFLKTLFNINTPESYQEACNYFGMHS